jgi:hypothetical protein
MSTAIKKIKQELMPFTDITILATFDQAAFVESTRSNGKVYENRQQRIATSNSLSLC